MIVGDVFTLAADELEESARSPSDWPERARPEQLPPESWDDIWYVRGSRGSGKTRTGAESLAHLIRRWKDGQWAVVAPTYGDARDTCIEGESGLLAAFGTTREEVDSGQSRHVKTWNRSLGELIMRSGATVFADGADDGALRVQGKNLRGAWCDEIGLWKLGATKRRGNEGRLSKTTAERAWDESVAFAVRKSPALILATGTPKSGHPLPRRLINDPSVPKTYLRLEDNEGNLDPKFVRRLHKLYDGTRLGRQELGGELLDDVEGALWTLALLEEVRCREENAPEMVRVVVAVDPAAEAGRDSDETGIVVCGLGVDGRGYVLADRTCRMSPAGWAKRTLAAFAEFQADRIIPERNNGGAMVTAVLRSVDATAPIKPVWASKGKRTRAEPIASLYEQGRISHVGSFPQLEDELTTWTPQSGDSPNRLDALVWGMSELMGKQQSSVVIV